jgi:radical SAM protein with 4Fe4S-binding SPASM domain
MIEQIRAVQIDVNGLCNAGCWFCPVSYEGNPKSARREMPLEELDNLLKQLKEGKGDFVDPNLELIYTANYNEVLLYKYFEEMFDVYRKYGFKVNILTNGVALTKSRVDIMYKNKDVIKGILLNIPSGEKETWAKYVKMNSALFDKMVSNVKYAIEKLNEFVESDNILLMVNGVNSLSLVENGGWLELLEDAPDIDLDVDNGSLATEDKRLQELFPGIKTWAANHLYDRAGHLENFKIIGQSNAISKYLKPKGSKVIGCNGGIGYRSRTNNWIHVNPNGDFFICCADFDFETVFGNINKQTLKEIWYSKERQNAIQESYSDMCTKCSAAIWGD